MKRNLRMLGAFAVLATLALAISCRGFFVKPTLTSITIAPSAPQVEINQSLGLTVFGTFNDGSTGQVSSGVSWSSSAPAVASFSNPTSNLLQGISLGTATVTANAQAVTATATATVFLGGISKITVSPNSGSFSAGQSTQAGPFTASATANGTQVDITSTGTWSITPATTLIDCSFNGTGEVCSNASGQTARAGTYTLTVSYPGTAIVGTATLNVTP